MPKPGLPLLLLVLMLAASPSFAQSSHEVTIPPRARSAIDKALEYLAKTQKDDGSWETSGRGKATACMSLAALAFLSDGHQPGRGRYGEVVEKALGFVLKSAQPSGLLEYGLPGQSCGALVYS